MGALGNSVCMFQCLGHLFCIGWLVNVRKNGGTVLSSYLLNLASTRDKKQSLCVNPEKGAR